LGVDACNESLTVCAGEGDAKRSFGPAFDVDEDWVAGGACPEIIHPRFYGVEDAEADGDCIRKGRMGMYIGLFLSMFLFRRGSSLGVGKC
jgi:hypothetical protein